MVQYSITFSNFEMTLVTRNYDEHHNFDKGL